MATNYEILMSCSRKQMAAFINSLVNKEVSRYIDWNSWLRSEDPEPVYFGTDAFFKEDGGETACRLLEETEEDGRAMRSVYMILDKGGIRKETVPAWLVRKADEESYPASPLPEISEEEILQTATESDSILEELLAEAEIAAAAVTAESVPAEEPAVIEEAPVETEPLPEEPQAEELPAEEEESQAEPEFPAEEPFSQDVIFEEDEDELPEIVTGAIEIIPDAEAVKEPQEEAEPAAEEISEPAAEEIPAENPEPAAELNLDELLFDSEEETPAEEPAKTEPQPASEPQAEAAEAAEEIKEPAAEETPAEIPEPAEEPAEDLPEVTAGTQEEAEEIPELPEKTAADEMEFTAELDLDELLFGDGEEINAENEAAYLEATRELSLEDVSAAEVKVTEAAEETVTEDTEADDLQFDIDEDAPVMAETEKHAVAEVQEDKDVSLDELLFGDEKADEDSPAVKLNEPGEDEFSDISLDSLLFEDVEAAAEKAEAAQAEAEMNLPLEAMLEENGSEPAEEPADVEVDDEIWKAFEDAIGEADKAEEEVVKNIRSSAEEAEEKSEPEETGETDEDEGNEFFSKGRIEMLKESLFDDEDQPPVGTGDLVFRETTAIEFPRNPSDGDFPQEHEPAVQAPAPKHMAKKPEAAAEKKEKAEPESFYSRLKKMNEESEAKADDKGDTFSRIFDEPNPFEEEEEADFRSDGLKRFLDDIKRESMLYDPDDPEDQELPTIAFSPMDESKEKMF